MEPEQRKGKDEAPRAAAADFEPPRLTVIGTVAELTQAIKTGPFMDAGITGPSAPI